MQLTDPGSTPVAGRSTGAAPTSPLRAALAAATAALLAPGGAAAQAPAPTPWQVDSAVLVYQEGGGRVRAIEPVISARRTDGNDRTLGLKLTLDALTGASPNGAVAQPTAQTFTSPSGKSSYTTAAGAVPLDTSFHDRRVALAGSLERPFGDAQRLSLGANLSVEYDFVSASVNAALARDFNQKNTTLSVGLALETNRIKAVGGAPVGLQSLGGSHIDRLGQQTRNVADVLLGVTQVINRQWLMQTNLNWGRSSGDHSDAYKRLSVVDGGSGLLTGDRYVSEKRPDSRSRLSLFWQNKLHLTQDVVDLSYRFYRDDWGVRAHTLDLRYRFELGGSLYLEPRWRLHKQGKADFSRAWLQEGQGWDSSTHSAGVAYASADPRLAAFSAQTVGAKLGLPLGKAGEFSARVELYRQTPKALAGAPGVLSTLELTPTLKATTVMLVYSLPW